MPEIPDLEVIREYLEAVLPGQRIESAEVLRPLVVRNLLADDFVSVLNGNGISGVRRRGKFLLFDLESGQTVVINPMLVGRLLYCQPEQRRAAKTVLILHLSNGMDLRYVDSKSMGKVYLTSDENLVPRFAGQGPEALDPQVTMEVFRERLRTRRGEIKGLLTNQAVLAGIGNAYADEMLFEARLYPFRKRPSLSPEEVESLYQAMRRVLSEATVVLRERIGDDIDVKIRDFLSVHGKGGSPCPRCGTPISEIKARNRLTNFCRNCQPGRMIKG
ncbi:MAG TPA: DNA-formamidopyrimidine glycosylase family protein [Anaerolineae bacterium]|nr:DNA-formamidopyrimidine glycosylase family protein [Anaerolineae bacterium]